MSDLDKMVVFGRWLTERGIMLQRDLYSLSVNAKAPIDAIRVKAGHVECTAHILAAFKDLYNGDLNKFTQEYLGETPEEEKE